MNVELMDVHGTMIQATFFKEACDKFDPMLIEGGIYLMSGGTVKMANMRFATVKNDFCIVFDKQAEIKQIADDNQIKERGYQFVPLGEILTEDRIRIVDFIGVLVRVDPMMEITLRSGEQKSKRQIHIADEVGMSIDCCVWAEVADRFDNLEEENPVIAIKGCRVVVF